MIALGFVETLAAAGVVLFAGYGIRRVVPPLAKYNLPAPVLGGLLVATAVLVGRRFGHAWITFDTTLQRPLMIAFFTSIGFGASLSLLKTGGPQVVIMLVASTAGALLQNLVGIGLAGPLGVAPLFGVLTGSVALTGGPATATAFGAEFERAGVAGATTVGVAAAMLGIVAGGLVGSPIATFLIRRNALKTTAVAAPTPGGRAAVESLIPEGQGRTPKDEDAESFRLLKNLVFMLIAMWIGSGVEKWLTARGITMPAYIGAMIAAAVIRNVDDVTGWFKLSPRTLDDIGNVSLALFLAMAMMTLRLWEIAGLGVPLVVMVVAQVALVAVLCLGPMFRLMGRDYQSAVMSAGFCGFMLGTTANAMANMNALAERYGPAPRAFLVIPIVGAFFIDFVNALIITQTMAILR